MKGKGGPAKRQISMSGADGPGETLKKGGETVGGES